MTLTIEDLSTISIACEAQEKIEKLQELIDSKLAPICVKVIQEGTLEELKELYKMLPHGFYKTEILHEFEIQEALNIKKENKPRGWDE